MRFWLMADEEGSVAGHGHCKSTSESLYTEEVVIVSSPQPPRPSDLSLNSAPSPCLFLSLCPHLSLTPPCSVNLSASSYHGRL